VSGSVCNVAMTSTKTISASFSTVTLTVQVSQTDASGAVQGNNPGAAATSAVIACGQGDKFPLTQCTSNNVPGTQLTLTATLGSGDFDGWTGCPTVSGTVANRCTVTLDGPQGVTVNASFSKSLAIHKNGCTPLTCSELDVMAAGTGTGTISDLPDGFFVYCGGVCSIMELPGTVQLLATPDPGSIFGGWSGCDSTNGNVCTITLPSDPTVVAITATFVATTPQARPPGTRPAPR